MKQIIISAAFIIIGLAAGFLNAQTRIVDKDNKEVMKSGLKSISVKGEPFSATIVLTGTREALKSQVCDSCPPCPACPPCPTCPTGILTIDGMTFEISSISIVLNTVSTSPIPPPTLQRPNPPFPACWWGPKPTEKMGLVRYCDGRVETQGWADWLKAHPEDLDWAWTEYKKSN